MKSVRLLDKIGSLAGALRRYFEANIISLFLSLSLSIYIYTHICIYIYIYIYIYSSAPKRRTRIRTRPPGFRQIPSGVRTNLHEGCFCFTDTDVISLALSNTTFDTLLSSLLSFNNCAAPTCAAQITHSF